MNTLKITFSIAALASAVFAQGYATVPELSDVYSSTAPAYQAIPVPSSYETTTVEIPSIPSETSVEDTEVEVPTPGYSAVPPPVDTSVENSTTEVEVPPPVDTSVEDTTEVE
ncbi:hypothetical protein H4S08_000444, partial [Coemansia sp. RSA 1365]